MVEKHAREFYPTFLFLVTGFSFLLFTLYLRLVDDLNIKLFLWIGLGSFVLGLLTGVNTLVNRARRNKANLVP